MQGDGQRRDECAASRRDDVGTAMTAAEKAPMAVTKSRSSSFDGRCGRSQAQRRGTSRRTIVTTPTFSPAERVDCARSHGLIISVSSERTYPSTVDANSSTVGMTSLAPHRISKPQKIATKAGNSSIGAANFYSSHVAAEKSINADTEVTQPAAICASMMIAGANDRNSPVGAIINHCERMAPAPQPAPMSTWTRFGAGHRYR